jgi:hypothetical protein
MAQAFITGLKIDPPDTLNVTISVQQADPLSFNNQTFQMPFDDAFKAMSRQQQRAAIFQAYKAAFSNPVTQSTSIDPSQFPGAFTV